MTAYIPPRRFSGRVTIPASKSHTIRRLCIAALAQGGSCLTRPLDSLDSRSCLSVCRAFGARINVDEQAALWTVEGTGGALSAFQSRAPLDVGNSGTTLFFALAMAALGACPASFTGDEQIKRRSAKPLLDALSALGAAVQSRDGFAPFTVCGPLRGGRVSLSCPTSQYLSALLLTAPCSAAGTVIELDIPLLNERPYIEMTLSYLDGHHIPYRTNADFSYFRLEGGAAWQPVNGPVPADFSSAAFPALAAVVSGGTVELAGLDPNDTQGDKAFFKMLAEMGAEVTWLSSGAVRVACPNPLRAAAFDLNDTPDLLPACAALAACARGRTHLYHVAHARIKETDRIAVMAAELGKLGVHCEEQDDGLIIEGTDFRPITATPALDGHGDHRVVMSLAALGCALPHGLRVTGAEAADVTYPDFLTLLGAEINQDYCRLRN